MRIALVCALFVLAHSKHLKHRGPVIDLHGADQLTATIREDEILLNTVPDLAVVADSGPICKYIFSSTDGSAVPFESEVVDRVTGHAVVRVKNAFSLDCNRISYNLQVQAVRCDDEANISEAVPLKVTVKDTNNHVPEFDSPWYTFHVDEGESHKEVATLKATDADCGDPFGEICEYRISNALADLPFTINNQGVLKTTEALNYTAVKSYILTIVAIDCGMRESKSALVTVHVNEKCVPSLKNTNDRVTFTPGNGKIALLPNVETKFCNKDSGCEIESIESKIELNIGHVSSGCSRDTLFNNQTIATCGLNPSTVQLMRGEEGSAKSFDGAATAVVVPKKTFNNIVSDKFSLSFSMRHPKGTKEQQNSKQHILCESDELNLNRHHFSVYVRHCKLEVVLRREAGATAEFRAAEWRWALSQVCDNEWHSYSLLFNGVDDVKLMVDGHLLTVDEKNPEILDDWPLHKTTDVKTRMVVGACWHGRQQNMAQFFMGELSEVHLLQGAVESDQAIECAHRCQEHLDVINPELQSGESIAWRADKLLATITAKSEEAMNKLLKKIAYVNTAEPISYGHRSFAVNTKAICKNAKIIDLPVFKGYVFVEKQALPTIAVSGSALISADHHNVKIGTPMMSDIKITVTQTGDDGEKDVTESSQLDYCKVHLKPSRDMDLEYFSSPASLIAALQIDFEHDKEGILLRGTESVKRYLDVLSKVHYFNTRPETYSKRIYSVQCAMAKGKVMSNEFIVTMTIVPPTVPTLSDDSSSSSIEDTLDIMERHFEPVFDQLGSNRLQNILEMDLPRPKALLAHRGYDVGQGAIAGGAVAVVVVVCVGFLLVLLVVGVLKMRDTPVPQRRKNKRQDDDMHWDDAGMNITVNPMEDVEKNVTEEYSDDESSDAESECSFRDEDVSDEEEGPEVLPHLDNPRSGLEWDDEATLTPNSRSYRV